MDDSSNSSSDEDSQFMRNAQLAAEEEAQELCDALLRDAQGVSWRGLDDNFRPMDYFTWLGTGIRRQGGLGVSRPRTNHGGPRREYAPGAPTKIARRVRDWKTSYFWQRFMVSPPREGQLAWDEFRLKFRTPWPVFNYIVAETRRVGIFPDETVRKQGRKPFPLGLKVAAALRYLALGVPIPGLEDGSGLSAPALQQFMFGHDVMQHDEENDRYTLVPPAELPADQAGWFYWFVKHFEHQFVRMPTTTNEIRQHQRLFAMCGFPGAIGSQDGLHPGCWDNCPSQEKYLCTGKEGFPTLVYNMVVGHTRQLFSMHGPFAGTKNDKTIVRTDPFIHKVQTCLSILMQISCAPTNPPSPL